MDYLDFELRISAKHGRDYEVEVVRSPAGKGNTTLVFPFDHRELASGLKAIQSEVLRSADAHREINISVTRRTPAKDFGRTLFNALLNSDISDIYRESRNQADQQHKGLRLRLRIEDAELAALPWEFLYDNEKGDFVCLSNKTPVIRSLKLRRPPKPLSVKPPLRILGMVASPVDLEKLDDKREKFFVQKALEDLTERGLVSITWMEGQTWRDLLDIVRDGWHVFHFIGHGGFDQNTGKGSLALVGPDGKADHLDATELGRLLADVDGLRLCILNTCKGAQASATDTFSSTASSLIRMGVPAVVAMQYAISDKAANDFSRVFYEALADGLAVDAAVAEARKAMSIGGGESVEWATPVLHMRSPDGQLFKIDSKAMPSSSPAKTTPLTLTEAPSQAQDDDKPALTGWQRTVKRFGVAALVILALLLILLAYLWVDAYKSVTEELHDGEQMMAQIGFDVVSEHVERISLGAPMKIRLVLDAGATYQFNGLCDSDCHDLELRLYDQNSVLVSEDIKAGGRPVVQVNPAETGIYTVEITLADSTGTMVYMGLGIYRKN